MAEQCATCGKVCTDVYCSRACESKDTVPAGMQQIDDSDWLYVCAVALKTQDCVQRNLLEIIARVTERTLPAYPTQGKAPA